MMDEADSISKLAELPDQTSLYSVVNDAQLNAHKAEAVSHSIDRALSHALHMPSGGQEVASAREEILGGAQARLEKAAIVADVDPDSLTIQQEVFDEQTQALVDRVNTLYGELAKWTVSWGVSHRVQQDVSQILKGQ